jgi:hypothetical protein
MDRERDLGSQGEGLRKASRRLRKALLIWDRDLG